MTENRICSEFERQIVDALVDGLDPQTHRHLESCAACAALAREYLGAAEFARGALRTLPFSPKRVLHPTISIAAIAATIALLTFAAFFVRTSDTATTAQPITVLAEDDAIVERVGANVARIHAGESTFVLRDSASTVETPFGSLRCPTGCEFTVRIEGDECGWTLPASLDPAGLLSATPVRLAIDVASGEVVSHQNGRADILAASHRLNLPFDHYR